MDDQDMERAHKIDRYIKGEMSSEERKTFEYKLSQDKALKDELEKTEISVRAIQYKGLQREVGEIRGSMKDEENPQILPLEQQKETIKRPLPLGFYAFRVAASLLIVLVAFAAIQMAVVDPQGIYQEKINFEVVDVVERSNEESPSLSNILEAYQQDNFQDALAFYGSLDNPTVKEHYIAAAAHLKLEAYQDAASIYQQILDGNKVLNSMNYWEQRAAYNLAITNLQLNNYDEAIQILDQLKSDEEYGDYYDQLVSDYALWKLRLLGFKNSLFD